MSTSSNRDSRVGGIVGRRAPGPRQAADDDVGPAHVAVAEHRDEVGRIRLGDLDRRVPGGEGRGQSPVDLDRELPAPSRAPALDRSRHGPGARAECDDDAGGAHRHRGGRGAGQPVPAGRDSAVARSLAGNQVLCDPVGAQGGVLERNVTAEVVLRHERVALARLTAAADLLRRYVPELGAAAETFCSQALVLAGALAPDSSPPPGVRAAYEAEPALAVLHLDLQDSLQLGIRTMLLGAVPRA